MDSGAGEATAAADAAAGSDADAGGCVPAAGELVFTEPDTKPVSLASELATAALGFDMRHGSKACPISLLSTSSPQWSTVVLNATGGPAKLEAWGACTDPNHEINVLSYRRATPPSSSVELADCEQASTGYEGHQSPSPAGSGFCKGLLAENGQAITLEACGRAVVVFAFGSDSSTKPPPLGNIRLTR